MNTELGGNQWKNTRKNRQELSALILVSTDTVRTTDGNTRTTTDNLTSTTVNHTVRDVKVTSDYETSHNHQDHKTTVLDTMAGVATGIGIAANTYNYAGNLSGWQIADNTALTDWGERIFGGP